MSSGVVEVFPILDADQIRELDRIVQTAVPAGYAAATQEGRSQLPVLGLPAPLGAWLPVLGLRDGVGEFGDIAPAPRYARRLVDLRPGRLGDGEKRRIANSHDPVCQIDLSAQGPSRTSGAVL